MLVDEKINLADSVCDTIIYQYLTAENYVHLDYDNNTFEVGVSEVDCLLLAKQLIENNKTVCLLNMANQFSVGGDHAISIGGQEEYIIRNTNLLDSLRRIKGVKPGKLSNSFEYYLDGTLGFLDNNQKSGFGEFTCLFTEKVTINNDPKYIINVLSSSSYNLNDLSNRPEQNLYLAGTVFKIINQLRVAKKHKQRNLILGAFGCGAFANNPALIAEIYHAALDSKEFAGCFDLVMFSIKKRATSTEEVNNFLVFQQEFSKKKSLRSIVTILRDVYNQTQQKSYDNLQLNIMLQDFFKVETADDLLNHVTILIAEELCKLNENTQQAKILFVSDLQSRIKKDPNNISFIIKNLKLLDGYSAIEYGQGFFKHIRYPFFVKLEQLLTLKKDDVELEDHSSKVDYLKNNNRMC